MSGRKVDIEQVRGHVRRWTEQDVEQALDAFQRRRGAEAELESSLPEVRRGLQRWDEAQVENGLRALRYRMAEPRGRGSRWALAAAVVAAAAAVTLMLWRGAPATTTSSGDANKAANRVEAKAAGVSATERHLALADGSDVTLPESTSAARIAEQSPGRVVVLLDSGRAKFRVLHRPERRFVVQIAGVQVEDLGTVFNVERGTLDVSIQVLEGRVRVLWQGKRAELGPGEQGRYPLGEVSAAAEATEKASPPDAPAVEPKAPAERAWRSEAHEGRYKEAFQLLDRESFSSVRDEPSDLLLAADVARLSGHANKAVQPLRNLLKRHRADPRCPAAAFTLGSVLLRDLGRPGEAAQAFDDAVRLAPSGNLSEDAAARAAEAWFKAGQRARAQAALGRYEAQHPRGRHLAFLKRLIQSRD